MWQLLESGLELVIDSGFIYVPLLFDPAIENETRTPWKTNVLVEVDGRLFIKALSLESLVENYEKIYPDAYEHLRSACLQKYRQTPGASGISIDGKLRTILFQVMPHFIRRNKGLERRRLGEEEVLDLIGEKVKIPAVYYENATRLLDTDSLQRALGDLDEHSAVMDPPEDGPISAGKLREWLDSALEIRIAEREKGRLRQVLHEREQLVEARRKHIAILLYIAERGCLEIDGFGFSRIGSTDEYIVYKHTGEYALKDYYGRVYLFPDCRVAVSTIVPLRPFVIDTYKHPFLEGHDSGQEICLRNFSPPRVFTAANVISALEEGLSALLHGYSSRRRNGYHSLDRTTRRAWAVGPDDHTMPGRADELVTLARHVRMVNFDDYRVSRDHPKIASGQVEITNEYTP